jgi:hypothetical protein
MLHPKFNVGDIVELNYLPHARGEMNGYRIIRLAPEPGDEPHYWIKSICKSG